MIIKGIDEEGNSIVPVDETELEVVKPTELRHRDRVEWTATEMAGQRDWSTGIEHGRYARWRWRERLSEAEVIRLEVEGTAELIRIQTKATEGEGVVDELTTVLKLEACTDGSASGKFTMAVDMNSMRIDAQIFLTIAPDYEEIGLMSSREVEPCDIERYTFAKSLNIEDVDSRASLRSLSVYENFPLYRSSS
jgi:hypothetical protein